MVSFRNKKQDCCLIGHSDDCGQMFSKRHHHKDDCDPCIPKFPTETITTGPTGIPFNADRLIIRIFNPTQFTLPVSINLQFFPIPTTVGTIVNGTVISFNTAGATSGPIAVSAAPGLTQLEFIIAPANQGGTARITLTGAFFTCDDCEVTCDGLEASVAIGLGNATGGVPLPGLARFDKEILFEQFVVC